MTESEKLKPQPDRHFQHSETEGWREVNQAERSYQQWLDWASNLWYRKGRQPKTITLDYAHFGAFLKSFERCHDAMREISHDHVQAETALKEERAARELERVQTELAYLRELRRLALDGLEARDIARQSAKMIQELTKARQETDGELAR